MMVRRVAFTIACFLPAAHLLAADTVQSRLLDSEHRASALLAGNKAPEAEREYLTMLALARQAHDVRLEAKALNTIGFLQYDRGAMADALANLQTAYRVSVQAGDDIQRLEALSTIANVYADTHVAQYDRALEYYRQLLVEYEKHGHASDVADTLFNIGSTNEVKGDLKAAELFYRRALAMFQKLNRPADIAFTKRPLGSCLTKQGRPAEALPLLDASLAYYEQRHDEANVAMTRQYRGIALRRLGRPAEALRELEAARKFFEKDDNVRYLERIAALEALVYAQLGEWRNAYEASARQTTLEQKLAETRRDEISSRLRVEFDAEKKDRENRALARENALRATALREAERSRRLQIVVSALIALLAAALAILFWRQVVNTRRMRTMALTDELTRLPNRRHILTVLDIAFDAAKREGREAALIMLDIDRFKRINDTYGHAAGDTVLRNVARTCRLELRGGDQIGRVGGEEFLVILQTANAHQAHEIAERLRAAVERLDFSSVAPDLHVTISLGVHVASRYDAVAAIAAADELLYRAKEGGRNRVEVG